MLTLLGIYFTCFSLALVGYVVYRAVKGHPILSMFHLFLAGCFVFLTASAALSFFRDMYGELPVQAPAETGMEYAALTTIVVGLFLAAYHGKWLTFGIQNKIGSRFPAPNGGTLIAIALGLLATAAFFRFVLGFVPVVAALATIISAALASVSAGIASWVWSRNVFNPVVIALAMGIILTAIGLTIFQNFGRREVTSVVLSCVWGAYFGAFRHIPLRKAAIPFLVVGSAAILVVAAYSSARTEEVAEMSITQVFTKLFSASVWEGVVMIGFGQDTPGNTMWLLEARPENNPYDTLHSLIYAVTQPIPRIFWDSKPLGIGFTMVAEAGISGKSPAFNYGPGLVGHIMNDNPWLALWLYPILLAALLRIGDDVVRKHITNPFVVLPVGAFLGEIVALPRGELGLFLFRAFTATVTAYILMNVVARVLVALGLRFKAEEQAPALEAAEPTGEELVDEEIARAYTEDSR